MKIDRKGSIKNKKIKVPERFKQQYDDIKFATVNSIEGVAIGGMGIVTAAHGLGYEIIRSDRFGFIVVHLAGLLAFSIITVAALKKLKESLKEKKELIELIEKDEYLEKSFSDCQKLYSKKPNAKNEITITLL